MADAPRSLVLVIDDDPPSRGLAGRILGASGFGVAALEEPPPAALVARLRPDLVVLDYWFWRKPASVPFLQALRADPATARLPVLVVTAVPLAFAADDRAVALSDGMLAKPYRPAELLAAAAAVLGRGRVPAAA